MTVIAINRAVQFIRDDKTTSEQAAEFLDALTRQTNSNIVLSGTGSPSRLLSSWTRLHGKPIAI